MGSTKGESFETCKIDLFDSEGLNTAIKTLNWSETEEGLRNKNGDLIECGVCEETLYSEDIAAFFPGSVEAVCGKSSCYVAALYESEKVNK